MSQTQGSYLHLISSGDLFLKDSQIAEAITCYTKAMQLQPIRTWDRGVLLPFYNHLGIAYKRQGDYLKAQRIFEQAMNLAPEYPLYYSNLFTIYKLQNRLSDAEKILLKAIALPSRQLNHFIMLGEYYKELKAYKKWLQTAIACVKVFPNEYEAHLQLGNVFSHAKQYAQALHPYLAAIKINPKATAAYNNVGVVYKELGKNEEAKQAYQRVLDLNPKDSAVHNNIGNLLRNMGNFEGAVRHLQESIRLNPDYADAWSNIGAVYKEMKNYTQAEGYYRKALTLKPHHINANFDLSLIELSRGDYLNGWKRYEYRLGMAELISKLHPYRTPMWRGEALKEKTILLQNEQGYGDNLMFVRYVPKWLALGAKVVIRTRPELVSLFQTIPGVAAVYSEEEEIVEHDYHFPLLSAPYYFQTTLESIPKEFPYLYPKKDLVKIKKESKKTLTIGLVWSSSRTNKDFKNKYIGLERFQKLFSLKNSQWYSLQVGDDADQIKALALQDKIIDLSDQLDDFSKTASLIESLDLIITSDTSVAHLCGAMDKEAWVLVPKPADWRWMQEGEKTPWYRSLKLFRQDEHHDWNGAIETLYEALKKRIG